MEPAATVAAATAAAAAAAAAGTRQVAHGVAQAQAQQLRERGGGAVRMRACGGPPAGLATAQATTAAASAAAAPTQDVPRLQSGRRQGRHVARMGVRAGGGREQRAGRQVARGGGRAGGSKLGPMAATALIRPTPRVEPSFALPDFTVHKLLWLRLLRRRRRRLWVRLHGATATTGPLSERSSSVLLAATVPGRCCCCSSCGCCARCCPLWIAISSCSAVPVAGVEGKSCSASQRRRLGSGDGGARFTGGVPVALGVAPTVSCARVRCGVAVAGGAALQGWTATVPLCCTVLDCAHAAPTLHCTA